MDINLITEAIIACAIKVSNTLGAGFLEKVYENALVIELRKGGWVVEQQKELQVRYDSVIIGAFAADLVVNRLVIVELKAQPEPLTKSIRRSC